MEIRVLEIRIADQLCGHVFLYARGQAQELIRFVPAETYVTNPGRLTLSQAYLGRTEDETVKVLRDVTTAEFNGSRKASDGSMQLPAWFQNLLPEGAFLDHIAELRGCARNDHFEIFAACGKDLPGAVEATPADVNAALTQRLVTQDQDALEMSVVDVPMREGVSLSGVQPKLSVNEKDGRYVARTKIDEVTRIIAKLPVVKHPLMPEVEHTSMELAKLAGVDACETKLVPLSALEAKHGYDLGDVEPDKTKFLAVKRYDRDVAKRVHAEDFAQIFNVVPDDKYTKDVCYAQLMLFMQQVPSLGESAVFEFLRRLVVSELLGNPDLHMKNAGVYYPDGVNPVLPPAYDIVSHYVLNRARGHALHILPREAEAHQLEDQKKTLPESQYLLVARPGTMRALGKLIGIAEKRLSAVVDEVVRKAAQLWPDAIRESPMTSTQKRLLLDYFESHPAVEAIRRREQRRAASQPAETSGTT
jgi:serine/threonine-protein kinase HipA